MGIGLDMSGTVDGVFQSVPALRYVETGAYVNGRYIQSQSPQGDAFVATIQPVSPRELQSLTKGGERILDARRVYVNNGDIESMRTTDLWEFFGINGVFRVVSLDCRPWRNYCKLIVSRKDDA